jgi:hypothetical protein
LIKGTHYAFQSRINYWLKIRASVAEIIL